VKQEELKNDKGKNSVGIKYRKSNESEMVDSNIQAATSFNPRMSSLMKTMKEK
jgi:hypothetical protein